MMVMTRLTWLSIAAARGTSWGALQDFAPYSLALPLTYRFLVITMAIAKLTSLYFATVGGTNFTAQPVGSCTKTSALQTTNRWHQFISLNDAVLVGSSLIN
jgi:hypothetical protein